MRRSVDDGAAGSGGTARGAARVGTGLVALVLLALACRAQPPEPVGPAVFRAAGPSDAEHYCAWYGDARDGVLYFGEAAFWSGFEASGGDSRADLDWPGPQRIGRFDLEREAWLPPLDVTEPGARSGVWDVHAHRNGRVYFTTYYETMGWVDPKTGEVRRLPELGTGQSEIAPGPGDSLLVSRYGALDGTRGSVLVVSADGALLAELPIEPPTGYASAPKTVAFDPGRREMWATTDLIPTVEQAPIRHDTYVLSEAGDLRERIAQPEIQFVAAASDGALYRAEFDGARLELARRPAQGAQQRFLLDPTFPAELDFAQDVKEMPGGGAIVTRWSGRIHVAEPKGRLIGLELPALEEGGLYYTAVRTGDRVCATYCSGIAVVCQSLPGVR
jgi:hypothetical protein